MDEKLTLTHTQYVPEFPKLSGKLSETYLNLIETYFEGHIESDSSKVRALLCSLPIEIVDQVTSICSKAQLKDFNIVFGKLKLIIPSEDMNVNIKNFNLAVQGADESFHTIYFRISKLHKKCDFDNDTRMIEKLICSLNDNIRRKLNKHKHEGLDKMMKLGVELDGSNIKPEISDTNYIDKNENFIKNDSKTFNSKGNLNNFRPSDINSRNYQNSNFRNNEGHSRNFSNNQSSNNYNSNNFGRNNARQNFNYNSNIFGRNNARQDFNYNSNNYGRNNTRQDYNNNSNNYGRGTWQNNNNSNYYGRNSMWHNNNNANNYDRNNAWQNNNNSNYNGRNFKWHDNSNSNNYDRNNAWHNNNRDGGNNTWKNYNLRKQIQYHDQSPK
ncbi:probable serine/threonine-protein kinase clkA [Gordionus sp. m RMFG-2023]|uniref:probable serine/threonine-protein kinase clkA n=1 Tax=Gordionus sp. m RMFG-2023 TaxID=3053472 RepID=UPI0031FCAE89